MIRLDELGSVSVAKVEDGGGAERFGGQDSQVRDGDPVYVTATADGGSSLMREPSPLGRSLIQKLFLVTLKA